LSRKLRSRWCQKIRVENEDDPICAQTISAITFCCLHFWSQTTFRVLCGRLVRCSRGDQKKGQEAPPTEEFVTGAVQGLIPELSLNLFPGLILGIANPLRKVPKSPALARFLYGQSRRSGRLPGIWRNSLESAPIPWNFARAPNAAAAPVFKLGYLGPVLKQTVVSSTK
jgi:hypothetical protein